MSDIMAPWRERIGVEGIKPLLAESALWPELKACVGQLVTVTRYVKISNEWLVVMRHDKSLDANVPDKAVGELAAVIAPSSECHYARFQVITSRDTRGRGTGFTLPYDMPYASTDSDLNTGEEIVVEGWSVRPATASEAAFYATSQQVPAQRQR